MKQQRSILALCLAALSPLATSQESTQPGGPPPGSQQPVTREPEAPSADALRERIHSMRMNLLTGGKHVRAAEAEAVDFFRGKEGRIQDRLDTVQVELSERRATYEVSLDTALDASSVAARAGVMKRAQAQRASIVELENESLQLQQKRADVSRLTSAIESRGRERDALSARLETTGDLDGLLDVPLGMVGLAPVSSAPATSPFEDDGLLQDLLTRDPRAGRALLYDADPAGYWQRFPLQPPVSVLSQTLRFPQPDLPGQR